MVLLWFDTHPVCYWSIAWSSFGALLFAALIPILGEIFPSLDRRLPRRRFPVWLFCALLAVTLFAFRWPLFFFEAELNPDESQLIAGAITLQHDPVFWRSVNGATYGPLDEYPLLLARLFFLPLDYGSARLVGTLLMLGTLFSTYRLLVHAFGDAVARVGLLPLASFLSFLTFWDLVHYSSEHVPVALLALAMAMLGGELVRADPKPRWSWCRLVGGIALGAAPYAKLQTGPIAAAVFIAVILLDAYARPRVWRRFLARTATLMAGALLMPLGFLVMTLLSGTTEYAWRTYILQNLVYAGDHHFSHSAMLAGFVEYLKVADGLYPFLAGCAVATLAGAGFALKFTARTRHLLFLACALALASFVAVLFPGRRYTHYLLLLVVPAATLGAGIFGGCWEILRNRPTRILLLAAFCLVGILPQILSSGQRAHPQLGHLRESQASARGEVARLILQHAKPGESLGQWGWMPRYHVQTRMPHATPEGNSVLEIAGSPQRDFYREHYLARLQAAPPPVFIDSVGPGSFVFENRSETGHETWEELADFIAARYELIADTAGTRIYLRKDRLPSVSP